MNTLPQPPHARRTRLFEFLLVAVVVIGATYLGFSLIQGALAEGRDTARLADIANIRKALSFYYTEHGDYPTLGWVSSSDESWKRFEEVLEPYISNVPRDPINDPTGGVHETGAYNYSYFSNGGNGIGGDQDYLLVFRLESEESTDTYLESDTSLVENVGQGFSPYPLPGASGIFGVRATK